MALKSSESVRNENDIRALCNYYNRGSKSIILKEFFLIIHSEPGNIKKDGVLIIQIGPNLFSFLASRPRSIDRQLLTTAFQRLSKLITF